MKSIIRKLGFQMISGEVEVNVVKFVLEAEYGPDPL